MVLGGMAATAHAQAATNTSDTTPAAVAAIDATGTYSSTWGAMTMQQQGTHVTGSYAYHAGTIDGTLDGNTLRFTWHEDDGSGEGILVRASGGSWIGSWGTTDDHSGGAWQLAPIAPGTTPILAASNAPAQAATTDGPKAGSLSFELSLPFDVTFGNGPTLMGVGGLGVGLGKRVSDNWYLGGTADVEEEVNMSGGGNGPDGFLRLRAGGEARYVFNHGTGEASVNCGPEFPVPRTDWVAFRAGAETLDEGTSYGTYGDVSIGTDFWLGSTQFSMYLQGGASIEPTATYEGSTSTTTDDSFAHQTQPQTTPASGNTTAGYFGMGFRFAFG
jgi:hypothetical protein